MTGAAIQWVNRRGFCCPSTVTATSDESRPLRQFFHRLTETLQCNFAPALLKWLNECLLYVWSYILHIRQRSPTRNFESKRRKRFPRSENEETTDRLGGDVSFAKERRQGRRIIEKVQKRITYVTFESICIAPAVACDTSPPSGRSVCLISPSVCHRPSIGYAYVELVEKPRERRKKRRRVAAWLLPFVARPKCLLATL